jgi:hypothetical protein
MGPLVFLHDTGAGATIVRAKDFRKTPIDLRPVKMPNFQELIPASGHITKKSFSLHMCAETKKQIWVVMPSNNKLLLGLNLEMCLLLDLRKLI